MDLSFRGALAVAVALLEATCTYIRVVLNYAGTSVVAFPLAAAFKAMLDCFGTLMALTLAAAFMAMLGYRGLEEDNKIFKQREEGLEGDIKIFKHREEDRNQDKQKLLRRLRGLEGDIKIFKHREEESNQDKQKLLRRLREHNQHKQKLLRRLRESQDEKMKSQRMVERLKEDIKIFKQREEEREAELERLQRNNEQCQMEMQKFEQRNKKLEKEMKQERTKQEQSEQKMRELEQIKIKLEEEIWEQETKLKYTTELDRYEMGEAPRGICLVINNFNFLGEEERQGAKLDEEAIARLFNELHFIVEIRQNLGGLEILKVAQEMAARDHSKYAAFVFCIMSHGDKKDVIYGVDNRKAAMEDLMCEFTATNCPTLENKPKLFFIQACRGQRRDPRMNRLSASTSDNITGDIIQIKQSADADLANGVSAREADFLLAFATVPGYKAWRSKQVGSWFIQELVDVIRMCHRRHHLLDMLTEVNKRVADIANEYPDIDLSFQVPAPTHTLRAQVFL